MLGEMALEEKPKSIEELIEYLSTEKEMQISEENQLDLQNIGYYHAYKGYRYIRQPTKRIAFQSFEELLAIYHFDADLKALFYPHIMFIETALKNRVLSGITQLADSGNFTTIYNQLLNSYKDFDNKIIKYKNGKSANPFKDHMKKRMELRDRFYQVQTNAYKNENRIAQHYLNYDKALPIWAIFELISLGEFGNFVQCLNKSCRASISSELGIRSCDDSNSLLLQRLIFAVKDLRNAIAHDDIIFDTRFCRGKIDRQVGTVIKNCFSIDAPTFQTITDYLILICYLLHLLGADSQKIMNLVTEYSKLTEKLRTQIPIETFNRIIYTEAPQQIDKLQNFIK